MRNADLSVTLVLTLLASGCGVVLTTDAASPDDIAVVESAPKSSAKAASAKRGKPRYEPKFAVFPEIEGNPLLERKVGDFFVHRFSGSFTSQPMMLTEEVIARAGGLVVIDYTLEQGKSSQRLRVTHDAATDRVLRVREMRGEREIAAKLEDFEAMQAKTSFAPDANERTLESEKTTCLVGPSEVDCNKTSYSVALGDRMGTLIVTQSAAFPGRDVAGEIVGEGGQVIYRAEIIDMGKGLPAGVASAE
jgi:hypothetical protein